MNYLNRSNLSKTNVIPKFIFLDVLMNRKINRNLILNKEVAIPYMFSVAVATLLSVEHANLIMSQLDFFKIYFPFINGYYMKSKFPEISAACFSLGGFIFFPSFIFFIKHPECLFSKKAEALDAFVLNKKYPFIFSIFGSLFFLIVTAIVIIQPGYQLNLIPINENRLVFSIFGPIFGFFTFYLLLAIAIAYIKIFIKLYIQ